MSDTQKWRLRCKYWEELASALLGVPREEIAGWPVERIRDEIAKAQKD